MKNATRGFSILLAIVTVFVYYLAVPAKVMALEAEQERIVEEYTDINDFSKTSELVYSPLVGEVEKERTANSKTFRRADGAYETVLYPYPVHYEKNNEWVDIDNSLVPVTDEKGNVVGYRNNSSGVGVQFATALNSGELVKYELDGKSLSWSFLGIENVAASIVSNSSSGSRVSLSDEEKDMQLRFPEELSSEILYEDASKGISIRYVLTSYTLSEYITLSSKPTKKVAYTLELKSEGMAPVQNTDGSISFVDGKGEEVLKLGSPVMDDANGRHSADFDVSLSTKSSTNKDGEPSGTYSYIIEPDMDWLTSDDCAYPVVIDPDIHIPFVGGAQDAYISKPSEGVVERNRDSLAVGSSSAYRSFIKFNITTDMLPADSILVEASLNLSRYLYAPQPATYDTNVPIDLYRVNTPWEEDTITCAMYDAYDSARIEGFACGGVVNTWSSWDITMLAREWISGDEPNCGVMLKSHNDSEYAYFRSREYNSTYSGHPYLSLIYVSATGLEGRWSYHSQSAGRAGTGSINDYTGGLNWTFTDASIVNGVLPITVSHSYNSNDKDIDIGYGKGWRLNYSQSIKEVTLTNRSETATYYELIDGDGTRHYYKQDGNSTTEYINELDKNSTLTVDKSTTPISITITDKGDNKLVFDCAQIDHDNDADTAAIIQGKLKRIEDANGNKTVIDYATSAVTDLRITLISEQLKDVTTGAKSILLEYDNNERLKRIEAPNGLNVSYSYNDNDVEPGNLCAVTYADRKSCQYEYANNLLTRAVNIDNYSLNYQYYGSTPYQVSMVQEKAGETSGQSLSFTYGRNITTVIDSLARKTIYQFDTAGQVVGVRNSEGDAIYAAYNSAEQTTTQLSAVSKMQSTTVNLLRNSGFNYDAFSALHWQLGAGAATYSTNYRQSGGKSMRFAPTSSSATAYVKQDVTVTANKTYTLSGYFTGNINTGFLRVLDGNGATIAENTDIVTTSSAIGTKWERFTLTFTPTTSNLTVQVGVDAGAVGELYADSMQLEMSATPSRYNLIQNGDFSWDYFSDAFLSYYQFINNGANDTRVNLSDAAYSTINATHPTDLDDYAYVLKGGAGADKGLRQVINTPGGKYGDVYSFGGWLWTDKTAGKGSADTTGHAVEWARITVEFLTSASEPAINTAYIYFSADLPMWQYRCAPAVAEGAYSMIRISINFYNGRNTAYFDGLQLYREEFSQGYTYDASGNLEKYTSLINQKNIFDYDDDDNLTSVTDGRNNTTTYTYDNKHNLLTSTSPEDVVTSYTYNEKGQVTETTVGNSTHYIAAQTEYAQASALVTAVTDARGNKVSYNYDNNTRLQTTVTDANNNVSTYSYGNATSMLRLASLTSTDTGKVEYTYDTYGKLTEISRGRTDYKFTYDAWSRNKTTKVGSVTLATNNYDSYGRLTSVVYGNGFKVEYEYDELDRTSKIYQKANSSSSSVLTYRFIYDNEGNLYELRNYKTQRSSFFEYDHAGRCMASQEKSFTVTGGKISYTLIVAAYEYEYDNNNNLTKLTSGIGTSEWETVYTYDGDNRPKSATLHNGRVVTNTYDVMGRLTSRNIGLTSSYATLLTYHDGNEGSKTALLKTYKNGSDEKHNYSYDANGNITQIWRGETDYATATEKYSYEYDGANQLVRENIHYGAGNANNKTIAYEYDAWGNLTQKLIYPYTEGDIVILQASTTVSFNKGIGHMGTISNVPADINVPFEAEITIPNAPTSSNSYDYFVGWNTSSSAQGTWYYPGDTTDVPEDMTLYAIWACRVDITYSGNVQTGDTAFNIPSVQITGEGLTFTVLPTGNPMPSTYMGAEFLGWNTKANGSGTSYAAGQTATAQSDMTLYAQWDYSGVNPPDPTPIPQTYTLTYAGNAPEGGSVSGLPASVTATSGSAITITAQEPTCTGYDFVCWNTLANGNGNDYEAGDILTLNANVTLYAQWSESSNPTPTPEPSTVTLTYDSNSNTTIGIISNMPNSVTVAAGTTVTISISAPTITAPNNSFLYWNTESDGTGTRYDCGDTITLTQDTTLYAIWVIMNKPVATPAPPNPGLPVVPGPTSDIMDDPTPTPAPKSEDEGKSGGTATLPTQIIEYIYGDSSWGDKLTAVKTYTVSNETSVTLTLTDTKTLSYDAMGNPTSYLGATLTWEGKQLASSTVDGMTTTYAYDENGLRTRKTVGNNVTNYYYNGSVLIGMTTGTITQKFSYDSSGNVISVNYNGTEYYYVRNGQGDIVKLVDVSGATVVEYTYDTWGKQLSCTGTLTTTLGTYQPFRYRGYVYDEETGWYYLQSRYYDPTIGRFISADVYLSTGQGVLGHNAYAYCLNNPVNM
ncbi:MAG: InlB B-repeat-containing protein, partial [Clostridia bacterium]|nr:InlB B-repeat-containing protein [Clostridia bacterium]